MNRRVVEAAGRLDGSQRTVGVVTLAAPG